MRRAVLLGFYNWRRGIRLSHCKHRQFFLPDLENNRITYTHLPNATSQRSVQIYTTLQQLDVRVEGNQRFARHTAKPKRYKLNIWGKILRIACVSRFSICSQLYASQLHLLDPWSHPVSHPTSKNCIKIVPFLLFFIWPPSFGYFWTWPSFEGYLDLHAFSISVIIFKIKPKKIKRKENQVNVMERVKKKYIYISWILHINEWRKNSSRWRDIYRPAAAHWHVPYNFTTSFAHSFVRWTAGRNKLNEWQFVQLETKNHACVLNMFWIANVENAACSTQFHVKIQTK